MHPNPLIPASPSSPNTPKQTHVQSDLRPSTAPAAVSRNLCTASCTEAPPKKLTILERTAVIGGVTFVGSMAVPVDAVRVQFFAEVDPTKNAQKYGATTIFRGMAALALTNSARRAAKVSGLEALNNELPSTLSPLERDVISGGLVASMEAPVMNGASVFAQVKATFQGEVPPTYRAIFGRIFENGVMQGIRTLGRGGIATGIQFAVIDIGLNVGNRVLKPHVQALFPEASKPTQDFITIFSSSVLVCALGGGQAEQVSTLMRKANEAGQFPTYGQLVKRVIGEGYQISGVRGAFWAGFKGGIARAATVAPQFAFAWMLSKVAIDKLEGR